MGLEAKSVISGPEVGQGHSFPIHQVSPAEKTLPASHWRRILLYQVLKNGFSLPVFHQPRMNFLSFLDKNILQDPNQNPPPPNLQIPIFHRKAEAPAHKLVSACFSPTPSCCASTLDSAYAFTCHLSSLSDHQNHGAGAVFSLFSHFHSHVLARGLTADNQRKLTGKAEPLSSAGSHGKTSSPSPDVPGLPHNCEFPCAVRLTTDTHTGVHHDRHVCLAYTFHPWKNQGSWHISESEINAVVPFIFSLVGLPRRDRINPRVYSKNSSRTQPCALRTAWLNVERSYFVRC